MLLFTRKMAFLSIKMKKNVLPLPVPSMTIFQRGVKSQSEGVLVEKIFFHILGHF